MGSRGKTTEEDEERDREAERKLWEAQRRGQKRLNYVEETPMDDRGLREVETEPENLGGEAKRQRRVEPTTNKVLTPSKTPEKPKPSLRYSGPPDLPHGQRRKRQKQVRKDKREGEPDLERQQPLLAHQLEKK